jgi:hypothetical protein
MTRLRNLPGEYALQQKKNKGEIKYKMYTYKKIPIEHKMPGLGINMGNMATGYYHKVLSNNPADIESQLFGIGQENMIKKFEVNPELNKLDEQRFFNTPNTIIMPEPLVVMKSQRPTGPFSSLD